MLVDQKAVLIGANKQGHILDYDAVVAYGAGTTVALWDPLVASKKGVYQTLNSHSKEVTCVRFLPASGFLVSAGEDGKICVWKRENSSNQTFSLHLTNDESTHAITTLCAVDSDLFMVGDSSGKVALWRVADQLVCVESFSVKKNFYPTCLNTQKIGSRYILVVGGTNSSLYVYTFVSSGGFEQCAVLEGHEDWIKSLAFVEEKAGSEYILASGSQDRYIRLWRLRLNEAIDDSDEDDSKLVLLSNKQYKFSFGEGRAAFSFEALIMGHDDWVTDLKWIPAGPSNKLRLLSSSADTALIVWEMDADSGIWVTASRLGELSIKGASTATGSSGGFWSCLWFENNGSQYILTSGRTGAVRVYKSSQDDSWESVLGVTGAVQEITDLVWSKDGTYALGTSLDQTTRLIAPWARHRPDADPEQKTWHEFARPQIHGYDMICADNISSTKFVSGGDEKILRVFEMTRSINNLLAKFCDIEPPRQALPEAASLPVLGLSNKAANEQMEAGEAQQREEDFENEGEAKQKETVDLLEDLQSPPLEDFLQRHTLFPEVEKLYGHGYEITCCATSPDETLIASACRSNSAKHAVVKLFNVRKDYQLVEEVLKGHNLTITSLEFSVDGKYLLAVSRDRQFSLWEVVNGETGEFRLVELNPKAHTRIIWDCSWAPLINKSSAYFVTGSRDKTLKAWSVKSGSPVMTDAFKTHEPITSVACYQTELVDGAVVIGVGHESGNISIYKLTDAEKLERVTDFAADMIPASRVSKLTFSRKKSGPALQLAVGSTDTSFRIYEVEI